MKNFQKFVCGFLTSIIMMLSHTANAVTVDKLIVFGDSTSDNGNLYSITSKMHKVISKIPEIPKVPPYYEGRFSNGPIWPDYFGEMFGIEVKDYAYGGSWAEPLKNSHQMIPFSLGMQVNFYLVKGAWDTHKKDHLYAIWTGANDYLDGRKDAEEATTNAVANIRKEINSLIYYGAKQFMVFGIPDLSTVPKVIMDGPIIQAEVKELSDLHNKKLKSMMASLRQDHPEIKFVFIDIEDRLADVILNPGNYGMKNVTQACYGGNYYLGNKFIEMEAINAAKAEHIDILGNASLRTAYINSKLAERGVTPCSHPENYLYWDKVHPTTTSHLMMAQLAVIELNEQGIVANK